MAPNDTDELLKDEIRQIREQYPTFKEDSLDGQTQ